MFITTRKFTRLRRRIGLQVKLFLLNPQSSRPLQARVATATFSTLQTLRHVANKTQQMRGYRTATLNEAHVVSSPFLRLNRFESQDNPAERGDEEAARSLA